MSIVYKALPIASALGAIAAIWSLRQPVPFSRFLLLFPPTLGVDLALRVQLDEWGRLFGLFLLWPALAVAGLGPGDSSLDAGHPADSPDWPRWLLLLAAAHAVLAAADWLTLAAALILFDLVALILFASPAETGRGFLANGLSGLIVLAAALPLTLGNHDLALAGGESLPATAALLVAVAALVRLAPYPLHFWLLDLQEMPLPAWRWPARLSSSVLGLYLVARIMPLPGEKSPLANAILIVGVVGCLATALLAWLGAQREPARAMPLVGLYQINLALLGWALSDERLIGFWLTLNLVLATTALAMHRAQCASRNGRPLIWWSAVPGGLAAAALTGLPLTVGMFVRFPLYRALLAGRRAGWLALLLLAEGVMAATLLRVWGGLGPDRLTRKTGEQPPRSLWGVMVLLTVPLLILGLFPSLVTWLAGRPPNDGFPISTTLGRLAQAGIGLWATLLLPPLMGYGIYRQGLALPGATAGVEARLASILRLGWLHRAVARLLDRARQVLWIVGTLLHGEGYLAWVTLSLLLVFLLILSR
jgi:NADH:ubiquinone oxidoreductase subunit 5 (subunit L)/multisubunit Na+/H+ antiporter MnhA subunit